MKGMREKWGGRKGEERTVVSVWRGDRRQHRDRNEGYRDWGNVKRMPKGREGNMEGEEGGGGWENMVVRRVQLITFWWRGMTKAARRGADQDTSLILTQRLHPHALPRHLLFALLSRVTKVTTAQGGGDAVFNVMSHPSWVYNSSVWCIPIPLPPK